MPLQRTLVFVCLLKCVFIALPQLLCSPMHKYTHTPMQLLANTHVHVHTHTHTTHKHFSRIAACARRRASAGRVSSMLPFTRRVAFQLKLVPTTTVRSTSGRPTSGEQARARASPRFMREYVYVCTIYAKRLIRAVCEEQREFSVVEWPAYSCVCVSDSTLSCVRVRVWWAQHAHGAVHNDVRLCSVQRNSKFCDNCWCLIDNNMSS